MSMSDPIADMFQINAELALFDPDLGEKPQLIALNKVDLPQVDARWDDIQSQLRTHGIEPMKISALARTNVRQLLFMAADKLRELPEADPIKEVPVYQPQSDPNEFQVARLDDGTFIVRGQAIERAAAMTYWEHGQAVRRFQRILETIGIDQELRNQGIQNGDSVLIGDHELEWQD